MKEKLRVGFLLDGMEVCAWWYAMVERILAGDYARVALLVVNTGNKVPARPLWSRGWREIVRVVVRTFLLNACDLLFRESRCVPDAFEKKDLRALLPDVPVLVVKPLRRKVSDRFRPEDIEAVRRYDLDVLIRVGFRVLRGDILTSARYGVWSYHHGDNTVNRGGPPGFWETMESWPEMGVVLQVLTEDLDNGKVLYRSYSCPDRFFIRRNRNLCYWKAMSFIPRKLQELHATGEKAFLARVEEQNVHPVFYSRRFFTEPNNSELGRLILKNTASKVAARFQAAFHVKQWGLLFDLKEDISSSFWRFKRILPPKDRFWADPHVISRDGKYYIFIEEFMYKEGIAHISVIVMDRQGNWQLPVTILRRPYHLSYPFVFEWEGDIYLVPESAQNRTIELYKCRLFPYQWEFQGNLMEGVKAYDTTLYHRDGSWWMFTNMIENVSGSSLDELFIFHSPRLAPGTWTPHRLNPVISDAKLSRPAGGLFERKNRLYRPSQMSYGCYGRAININEIKTLNGEEYREELVGRILPDWSPDILATHTLSHVSGLTVVDAFIKRRR